MKIKTIMKYYLTPIRMTTIKKISTNNKCWRGCGEKGTLLLCWWECKLVQPLWRFFKKLKLELPYDPAILLLGIFLKKIITPEDTFNPMFTAALFTIGEKWKPFEYPSTEQWIKKMWYIYTMEYCSAIESIKLTPFTATWMDLEIVMLSEIRHRKTSII